VAEAAPVPDVAMQPDGAGMGVDVFGALAFDVADADP
jgi:hypothetical protein